MPNQNQTVKNKNRYHKLKHTFRSTTFLTLGLPLIGFLIMAIGGGILERLIFPHGSDFYLGLMMIIGVPWIIAGAVFVIIRKEIPRPGLTSIKGISAIIQGYVGLIIMLIVEVILIYLTLSELIH